MAGARRKILCIENDRDTAALIAEELVKRGFEVNVAYDGQEGLLAIMKVTPDLILCAMSMPSMTGFEVLKRLDEIAPRLGKIPSVFLTALTDDENQIKGHWLGTEDYIVKITPIDFDRLTSIINTRLAGVARTQLNDRELQALTLVARGGTSAEIARELRVPKRTVDFHIKNACNKLHARTRTEAAIKAAASGLIKP
jgi:DNA-binding NarL/FixJ family response regulator